MCARFTLLALVVGLFSAAPASAGGPSITGDLTMVINFPAGHWTGQQGPYLQLTMYVSHGNGQAGFQGPLVVASAENTNNNNYPFANPTPLPNFYWYPLDHAFFAILPITVAQLPLVEGRYRYRVTDAFGATDQRLSHSLNRLEVIAPPTNLAVSNPTTTPVFIFTDPQPDPGPNGLSRVYNLLVIEAATGNNVALLPQPTASTDTPLVAIPPGVLCPCRQYYLRAQVHDIDNGESAVENMAVNDLPFLPTAATPTGDLSGDCTTNGRDIQPFVDAVMAHSTQARNLCAADFNANGSIDAGDVTGFVAKLLSP